MNYNRENNEWSIRYFIEFDHTPFITEIRFDFGSVGLHLFKSVSFSINDANWLIEICERNSEMYE